MFELSHITKRFDDHLVLDDFSLTVKKGSKLAIMGESGKGKTTLLRIIAGLEMPDSGAIRGFAPKDIAYVFQEPRLFESLTALKNLTVISNESHRIAEQKALFLLENVGLLSSAKKHPSELSGGMKQRLSLARAFMVDRPLLLLDEAFSALDRETADHMISFVRAQAKDKTVLLVTHNETDARLLCDEIFHLL